MTQLHHATWRPELDDTPSMRALRDDLLPTYSPLPASDLADIDPHSLFDCREYLKRENQRNMGSCQGNSLTTAVESLIWKQTGRIYQLSRMFAYIRSQLKDGIRSDIGSSLTAGVWVAKNVGLPLETYWPYPNPVRYTQSIPAVAEQRAGDIKLVESVRLDTYEAIVNWLRRGDTTAYAGMGWGGTMSNPGSRITSFRVSGRGGHAIAFPQVSPETLESDEPDIDLFNSHGTSWGDNGVARCSPDCIREMLDSKLTRMMGGFFGLRGVLLSGPDFADAFDDGRGGSMLA